MNIEIQDRTGRLLHRWLNVDAIPRVGDEVIVPVQQRPSLLVVTRVTWHTGHYVCLLTEPK